MASLSEYIKLPELGEDFTCAVCYDTLKDQMFLSCHHHFCKHCLVNIATADFLGDIDIVCPLCRETTELGIFTRRFLFRSSIVAQIMERVNLGRRCKIDVVSDSEREEELENESPCEEKERLRRFSKRQDRQESQLEEISKRAKKLEDAMDLEEKEFLSWLDRKSYQERRSVENVCDSFRQKMGDAKERISKVKADAEHLLTVASALHDYTELLLSLPANILLARSKDIPKTLPIGDIALEMSTISVPRLGEMLSWADWMLLKFAFIRWLWSSFWHFIVISDRRQKFFFSAVFALILSLIAWILLPPDFFTYKPIKRWNITAELITKFKVKGLCGATFDRNDKQFVLRYSESSAPIKVYDRHGIFQYSIGKNLKLKSLKLNVCAGIAVDTRRDIYLFPGEDNLALVDKTGRLVGLIPIDDQLKGVAFLPHEKLHVYVVSGIKKSKVYLVDYKSGNKIKLKFGGKGNIKMREPRFVTSYTNPTNQETMILASDYGNGQIKVFNTEGRFVRAFGRPGVYTGELDRPLGVTADGEGGVLVCDSENRRVYTFWEEGGEEKRREILGKSDLDWEHPAHIALDLDLGHLLVASRDTVRLYNYSANYELL